MKQLLLLVMTGFVWSACQGPAPLTDEERQMIIIEVKHMLTRYDDDIRKNGLPAEFNYLDNSPDFFWVPPGYTSPLSYDSVAKIIKENASLFSLVDNRWDTLAVYPLTKELATFTGRINSTLTQTSGNVIHSTLTESGVAIKRKDGWKLLSGQTTVLDFTDL